MSSPQTKDGHIFIPKFQREALTLVRLTQYVSLFSSMLYLYSNFCEQARAGSSVRQNTANSQARHKQDKVKEK